MKRGTLAWVTALASRIVGPLAFIAVVCAGYTQERFDLLHAGKAWYTNAVVTAKTPTNINITHAQGSAVVKVAELDAPTLARLGISLPSRTNTPAAATPPRPANLIMKKFEPVPGPGEKLANQLICGTCLFVGGFFFICNIIRPMLNGFLFKVGYFIYFGTGASLMALVENLKKHGFRDLSDSWLEDCGLALMNVLALIALYRIGARMFASRAAGDRQYASVRRITPHFFIISLTEFIFFGVYLGCYLVGAIIYVAC
jgi:hypothetical protein